MEEVLDRALVEEVEVVLAHPWGARRRSVGHRLRPRGRRLPQRNLPRRKLDRQPRALGLAREMKSPVLEIFLPQNLRHARAMGLVVRIRALGQEPVPATCRGRDRVSREPHWESPIDRGPERYRTTNCRAPQTDREHCPDSALAEPDRK